MTMAKPGRSVQRDINIGTSVEGHEGRFTRRLEMQTSRIPSVSFLGLAVAGMIGSAVLSFVYRRRDWGNFVGLWVPSILSMGIYNKFVKLEQELLHPSPGGVPEGGMHHPEPGEHGGPSTRVA